MKLEKRTKEIITHSIIIIILGTLEFFALKSFFNIKAIPSQFRLILYFLFISPIILIYLIILILSKLLRHHRLRRGGKFQARLIIAFMLVSLIPTLPLIILSNSIINRTIELWLTKSIEDALNYSLNLLSDFSDEFKKDLLFYSKIISRERILKFSLIFSEDRNNYYKLLNELAKKYRIDSLFLYNKNGELIFQVQYQKIFKKIFDNNLFQMALKGENNVINFNKEGDFEYISSYTPVYDEKNENILGVVILTKILPKEFNFKANKVAEAYQAYKQMALYKKPLVKGFTTMIIIIASLFIILISIIVSYFISKGITEPIRILLEGTRNISYGNLDFEIKYNAKDEIKLLINAFNQMTKDLKASKQALYHAQRIAAWREIAQKIAHEIKNPLTPIKLSAEQLKRKYGSPEFESILNKSVDTIIKEVDSLNKLVKEFSAFARMPQLNLKSENLNSIIYEVLNLFSATQNVKFIKELQKDLPNLNLDKERIKDVLVNLINNSIYALRNNQNGIIKLRTYSRKNIFGEFVYLEVEDNGEGIEKDLIEKIFDPYFTTKEDGTGLGLNIVEKIITEHKGRIRCESEKGVGTKFIIEFNTAV